MDTNTIFTLFGVVFANLVVVVMLHLHTASLIKSISDEMKDFHGRLCAIEERSKIRIHGEK